MQGASSQLDHNQGAQYGKKDKVKEGNSTHSKFQPRVSCSWWRWQRHIARVHVSAPDSNGNSDSDCIVTVMLLSQQCCATSSDWQQHL